MKKPSIRYLVASPAGDVPVDTNKLDYPLEGDPLKTPYRLYFQAIRDFLTRNNYSHLMKAITDRLETDIDINAIRELLIRTEKHGAFYHPASIEAVTTHHRVKFALNVAVTATGRAVLQEEFFVLKALHDTFNLPYIPKPFDADEMDSMFFLLEEWFEDFNEFHIAKTREGGQQIKLWEYGKGDRFLSPAQGFEIYRQAAQILTLFYDLKDFRLIYPWHHAAGDFVVKISDNDQTDVRLTTVRGYEPFMGHDEENIVPPAVALFYFLLHLSIHMRLDRLDGVGETVWADDFCVEATLKGFLQGLAQKQDFRDFCGSQAAFLKLLRSFSRDDLRMTFASIIDQAAYTKDHGMIHKQLERHIDTFSLRLQNCL